jgi:hypothetical protein
MPPRKAHTARASQDEPAAVTEPAPGTPHPPDSPPGEPQGQAASNASPLLPHNAQAGAARAMVVFRQIIALADDGGDGALAQIAALARGGLDDVTRFAPEPMHQAAADEVSRRG